MKFCWTRSSRAWTTTWPTIICVRRWLRTLQAKKQGSSEFVIPCGRQTLADYLGVERSAMSAELGKMRREGLLEVDRQHFRLLGEPL